MMARASTHGGLRRFLIIFGLLMTLVMAPAALAQPHSGTPMVKVTATDATASEAGTDPGVFTIKRTGGASSQIIVNFTVGGTATAGADYTPIGSSVVIPAGASTAMVTIAPINDTATEATETVTLTLTSGTGYSVGTPSSATLTIADDDSATTTVTVVATDSAASEATLGTGTFTVSRTGSTAGTLTVYYTLGGTASSSDYAALPGSVTIGAGSSVATVTVAPVNDVIPEPTETVILTITANAAYTVGSPSSATVTISDDDAVVVTVVASDATATEAGPTTGSFTVTRTGATTGALIVYYTLGGTASSGDYGALPGSVTLGIGQSGATVTVTPVNDSLAETTETVILTITANAAYTVGSPSQATVSISDNDTPTATGTRPTTKQQCFKGGWETYKAFKNQGDCVSFVATRGRNLPAYQ